MIIHALHGNACVQQKDDASEERQLFLQVTDNIMQKLTKKIKSSAFSEEDKR